MKRSTLLAIALIGVLDVVPAGAQQTGKIYRVAILTARTPTYDRPLLAGFRRTLAGLGYQEGKNLEIFYRAGGGDNARLPALADDLIGMNPDVIVTAGTLPTRAAQHATRSLPIVMSATADPIGAGFVASLARPGGNITGTANMSVELVGKYLQLLMEVVPRLRSVAVLRDPSNASNLVEWRAAQSVADRNGFQVFAVDVRSAEQIDAALKPHLRADAFLVLPDGVTLANTERIVRLVAAQRLPAVYPNRPFSAAGGLMSYGTANGWSQEATYVARILNGAKPADLPVENPTTFDLAINLRTAHSLGITIPQSILLRANEVIK